jgi:predicted PurR-regulated permease PerM
MTDSSRSDPPSVAARSIEVSAIVIGMVVLVLLLWRTADVVLLAFAGVLFGIFLRTLMNLVTSRTRLGDGMALLVVMAVLVGLSAAAIMFAAPSVSEQFDQFVQRFPQAVQRLRSYAGQYPLTRSFVAAHSDPTGLLSLQTFGRIGGLFTSLFGVVGALVIVFFIGLYGAAEPEVYRRGILRLVPHGRRDRAAQVLDAVVQSLRAWLNIRLLSMAVIGLMTTIGLLILHVPLALALGLIAALLTFIPYIGPTISAIPPILMGLMESPNKALWVVALSLLIHVVEAYLLTPMLQRRAMSLSPVLAIITQVILGTIWGLLGMALATPITAVFVVLVEMLYVEDQLGDRADIGPGIREDGTLSGELHHAVAEEEAAAGRKSGRGR